MERTYSNPSCLKFVEWAEEQGHEVSHYEGRNFYEGPAITVDFLGSVVGVPVGWSFDNLGKSYVVHPQARDVGS